MKKEFRYHLNHQEALKIINQAKIISHYFIIDEYSRGKRIRIKNFNFKKPIIKIYPTKIKGKIARIGFALKFNNIQVPTYLELKITDKQFCRWEIEFEGKVPAKFKNRESIRDWQILADQQKYKKSARM